MLSMIRYLCCFSLRAGRPMSTSSMVANTRGTEPPFRACTSAPRRSGFLMTGAAFCLQVSRTGSPLYDAENDSVTFSHRNEMLNFAAEKGKPGISGGTQRSKPGPFQAGSHPLLRGRLGHLLNIDKNGRIIFLRYLFPSF